MPFHKIYDSFRAANKNIFAVWNMQDLAVNFWKKCSHFK